MTTMLRPALFVLAAIAVLGLVTPAMAAAPVTAPSLGPAAATGPLDGIVTITVDEGTYYATPYGDAVRVEAVVSYTEPGLDPLATGLISTDFDLIGELGGGFAAVLPSTVTLKSDGTPITVTVEVAVDDDALAWERTVVDILAYGENAARQSVEGRGQFDVIARQYCDIMVDGTLPTDGPRPGSGDWVLSGSVHVYNDGNGPVRISLSPERWSDGDLEALDATTFIVDAHRSHDVRYRVTLPEDANENEWSWRVRGDAVATVTPPDGSPLATCEDQDTVNIGDTRESRDSPAWGVLGVLGAFAAAAVTLRRRI